MIHLLAETEGFPVLESAHAVGKIADIVAQFPEEWW